MNTTKITEQELREIKTIQDEYASVGIKLVQLQLAQKSGEEYLEGIKQQYDAALQELYKLSTRERELADTLNKEYGVGTLDMTTGEFTAN